MFSLHQAQIEQQFDAGERGRSGAAHHQLDLADLLAADLEAVEHGGPDGDRGAVLVVMEYRDFHALAQFPFDQEALRGLDVFEIDGPEGGLQRGDHIDEFVRIGLLDLDVEDIDAGEFLEQHRLAFHHRLGGQRPYGPQSEHRAAVADDPDQVAPGGKAKGIERVLNDRLAGRGNARENTPAPDRSG